MNEYKTKIHKWFGKWRVDYYLPYSGFLYEEFDDWKQAINEAFSIEQNRIWV